MKRFLTLAALAAATITQQAPAWGQSADAWEIGPVIRGRNYSLAMPPSPRPAPRAEWQFDFPDASRAMGHVHYVTRLTGPLMGASRIVVRYRVDAAPGVRFIAQERPQEAATVSLEFQAAGDSWSGKRHPFHRWYSPHATVQPLTRGVHELSVSLSDPGWISVFGQASGANRGGYAMALERTQRVGLVFGSASARGHGVFATGPARFTLLDFRIE
jgi:hypothetical protein